MVMEEDLLISIAIDQFNEDAEKWHAIPCKMCIGRGMRTPNLRDLRFPRAIFDSDPLLMDDVVHRIPIPEMAPTNRPGRGRGRGRGRARRDDNDNSDVVSNISSHEYRRPGDLSSQRSNEMRSSHEVTSQRSCSSPVAAFESRRSCDSPVRPIDSRRSCDSPVRPFESGKTFGSPVHVAALTSRRSFSSLPAERTQFQDADFNDNRSDSYLSKEESERFSDWAKYPNVKNSKDSLFMKDTTEIGTRIDYEPPPYEGTGGFYSGNAFGSGSATQTGGRFYGFGGFGERRPESKELKIRDMEEFPDLTAVSDVTDTPPRKVPSWGSPKPSSKIDEFPPLSSAADNECKASKEKPVNLSNIWNNEAEFKFIGNKTNENNKSRASPDEVQSKLVKLNKKEKKKKLKETTAIIKVENLPIDIKNEDLIHIIEHYGQVVEIETDRSGPLAVSTVWLSSEEACEWCISCLHDTDSLFPGYNHHVPLDCYRLEEPS